MKNEIRYNVELAKFVQPMLPLLDNVTEFTWDYLFRQCPKLDNGFYLQNGVLQLIAESQPEHSRFNYIYSDNDTKCTVELYTYVNGVEKLLSIGVDAINPYKKGAWLEYPQQMLLVSAKRQAIRNGYPLLNGVYEEDEVKNFEKKLIDPWKIDPTTILTKGLQYCDKEHKYTYKGKELISVTKLLKGGGNYSNSKMSESARKSEAVHNMLATHKDVYDFKCTQEIKDFVQAIRDNYLDNALKDCKTVQREVVMCNDLYAGTADLIYLDEHDVLHVVDYKGYEPKVSAETGIALDVKRQLTLYANLYMTHDDCDYEDIFDYVKIVVVHYWKNDSGVINIETRSSYLINPRFVIDRANEYYNEAIEKYWKK